MSNNTAQKCWVCGAVADSREHRIKRSDLVRRYGSKPFKYIGGLLHFTGTTSTPRNVQGPNAKLLTYKPMLCKACNTTASQPWDRAYEQFERWVFEHEHEILTRRFILLEETFGMDHVSEMCPALYKYFVKAFGCRLVDAGVPVPQDLVKLLPQDYFRTKLRLTFSINKATFQVDEKTRRDFLGLGDLLRYDSRQAGIRERYTWHMQVGWLCVSFFYDTEVPCGLGSVWTSDSACLYLGEFGDFEPSAE